MENKKNKLDKKSISIIVIVAIFLVIIMAITFAYFGNFFVNLGNMLNVNLSAGELSNAYLNATNTSFSIGIDPENMSEDNAGNFVITNESSLTVSLDAGTTSYSVKCTYDIMFEYDSTSSIYGKEPTPVSEGATKEFTLQASGPTTFSNMFKEETNFAYDDYWGSNPYKRTIASDVEIINTSSSNPTVQTWTFTNKFYNLDLDQTALANKKFKGRFYVDNTHCETTQDNDSETLYALVQNKYNEGNTFVKLYDGDGSDTYANPVYYYNGAVQDNNVYFADLCWKIVRTTDTGGVKLIYNGTPKTVIKPIPIEESQYLNVSNDANYPYTFDSTNKTWTSTNKTNSTMGTITFTVAEAGDYILSYTVSSEKNYDKAIFYKDDTALGTYSGDVSGTITLDGLTTSNVIKVEYTKDSSAASGSDNVVFSLGKTSGNSYLTCNNSGTDSQIGTSAFNSSSNSPAYVGYMYNTVYTISEKSMSSLSNIVFGNSFTYSGGTYTLTTDTMTVATWSDGYNTINNNHYTCFTTGTTCSSLYYVYQTTDSFAYYITLTGGKSVSDALNEMLYADDVNKTDSDIKTYIETWYENNMTEYTSYLEDTTYCNDRSILNLEGWNPNGGDVRSYLKFKNYNTNYSLVCGSVTDQFRVGNTKAPLKYPVGLLTAPEVWLAYKGASYSTYYLNTGQYYWLGSPYNFRYNDDRGRVVSSSGDMRYNSVFASIGARPSVSLKPGTGYISGDGAYISPFVIE